MHSIHRRYLGDPADPHYRPASPLIHRQSFTPWEEEDLRRACRKALSRIPHSTDDEDDNLRDLAQFIIAGVPQEQPKKRAQRAQVRQTLQPQKITTTIPISDERLPKTGSNRDDSATPSDTSHRGYSNLSTPLTSAGVTPAETSKRIFEPTGRTITNTSSHTSKHFQRPMPGSSHGSHLDDPSHVKGLRLVGPDTRSMSRLRPKLQHADSLPIPANKMETSNKIHSIFKSKFNKSLPALPVASPNPHTSMAIFDIANPDREVPIMKRQETFQSDAAIQNKKSRLRFFSFLQKKKTEPV